MKSVFDEEQPKKASFILESSLSRLSGLYSDEIKDLAIAWRYYPGKIEGNTYTYAETETLPKDGITAEKKCEDTKMLKNLYNGIRYTPPKHRQKTESKLNKNPFRQEGYINPLEKAVYLHCNLARLQPFIDGNKQTARMIESIALMNAGIIPVYSAKDSDILNYRKGLIAFYEAEDYNPYADYLLNRQVEHYLLNRQIERIKEIKQLSLAFFSLY